MNQRLPYEDELLKQVDHLPLPDENEAWEDMKRRLEKNNDDDDVVPPFTLGCLGYSLLFILIVIGLWLAFYFNWHSGKQKDKIIFIPAQQKNKPGNKTITNSTQKDYKNVDSTGVKHKYSGPGKTNDINNLGKKHLRMPVRIKLSKQSTIDPRKNLLKYPKKHQVKGLRIQSNSSLLYRIANDSSTTNNKPTSSNKNIPPDKKSKKYGYTDPLINTTIKLIQSDTLQSKDSDSSFTAQNIKSDTGNSKKKVKQLAKTGNVVKKEASQNQEIYFGAGAGLQQQVPINGQKLVPYNSLGRKATLADYIPSVYLKMYKEKKWFLQSEFRYGAPQSTKDILYIQRKFVDTSTNNTTNTTSRLKKTFYHQLPVSFSYFVLPGFSIGVGVTWNKFVSAISERRIETINNTTFDSTTNTTILKSNNTDSNFVKSYFQAIFETQYQWKRFSIGAKYSFGLQPYLKFQLPGGENREEKNNTLQVFIRYDLWQSRR